MFLIMWTVKHFCSIFKVIISIKAVPAFQAVKPSSLNYHLVDKTEEVSLQTSEFLLMATFGQMV